MLRKWDLFFPPIRLLLLAWLAAPSLGYLLLVPDSTPLGHVIFNASLPTLGRTRYYTLNIHKNGYFVKKLVGIHPKTGQVFVKDKLDCRGVWYPNLFTLHVDSYLEYEKGWKRRSTRSHSSQWEWTHAVGRNSNWPRVWREAEAEAMELRDGRNRERGLVGVQYYSMPLRVFIIGEECSRDTAEKPFLAEDDYHGSRTSLKISEARKWVSESYASFALPSDSEFTRICLKRSQFINSVAAFLPSTILSESCEVKYLDVNDPRFMVESSGGDLVASYDFCIQEPLWKIIILMEFTCYGTSGLVSRMEHRLKIVYHHQQLNDTDIAHRVRRELKNQSPYFDQVLYIAMVTEEKPPGVVVVTLRARDPENSPVTYSMTSLLDSRSQGMFSIDESSGVVTTQSKLDRELVDVHYFRITATDNDFPPRSGTTTLQINVIDANDHTPVFENESYEASIREGVAIGTIVITVRATDQDVNRNAEIEYSIADGPETFHIDGKTGVVSTRLALDRETTPSYTLTLVATDNAPAGERRSATAALRIKVVDDNDNYPQFTERTYTVTVAEDYDVTNNPLIATVKATDSDEGQNAAIRYAIIGGNMQAQFSIDSLTGDVFLAKPLDYEVLRSYRLVIRAQDGGSPSGRSNTTQLLVNVKDVNDNSPRFYSSLFQESVLESVPSGYSIVRVQAYDADEGSNSALKYSLSSRDEAGTPTAELPISIDSSTGWITTTRELDREGTNKYQFQVLVEDSGEPAKTATASVMISVQDVNDNDPLFNPKMYEVVVSEQDPPGTLVTTVSATDPDENPRLHYEITNGNVRGRFSITSQNNRGLVTISQPLDYRQEKRFILTVTATDSGGRSDIATVYVNVSDANNYSPVFENAPYSAQVFEDAPVGTTVLVVQASDSDVGQNAQITYTLGSNSDHSSDSFSINPQTGAILTTKLLDREAVGNFLLTVTARDGGVPSQSDTTDIEITVQDVNDNAPVFSSPSYSGAISEDALVGTSVLQVQATDVDMGLNGKLKYSLTPPGGDLPPDNSFMIDASSGVLRTSKTLDRESVAQYSLIVYAIDRGSPALSSSVSVNIRVEDVNDSPPAFESEKLVMYIAENSPIGSTVGEIRARDPDEGQNAVVEYSIIGGEDSTSFTLLTRQGWDKAELLTMVDLDYESPRKKFELVVRAASPPLRSDVRIEILVTDVNDNAPVLKDFQVIFNNFRDCFPSGVIGVIPAFDADVSDQLHYRILSGNNANLVLLNETSGEVSLSPQLNTNVPKLASMEVSVTDGVNDVKATMTLSVRLITEDMLFSSVTVRLADMTEKAFLSPLLGFFVDALAAIIPCPREYVYLFSVQDDTDVENKILNVSFSARRPDVTKETYFTPQHLQERVYLNRAILARLSTVQVLPFDDNLCVREPCLNFEQCLTVLKFGNASGFIASDTVLFRPIYPVSTFACKCPTGFTGSKEHYLCDAEVDLCYSNPCDNGGSCIRKEGGYTCVCQQGFTGSNCEVDLNLDTCQPGICNKGLCAPLIKGGGFQCHCHGNEAYAPPKSAQVAGSKRNSQRPPLAQSDHNEFCQLRARGFSKASFLTFPALRQRHRLHIKLRFATQSENGLLLYNGRYNEKHDFIAIEVLQGRVQLSFSLGSNVTRTVASVPGGVSDGGWHTVQVSYYNKTVTLSLDECDTQLALKRGTELGQRWACANRTSLVLSPRCALFTETCHRFMDLTGPLQLGGLPSLPTDFQVQSKDYEGCIADLYIDNEFIDLNSFVADNGTHPGCHHKKNFCSSNPCKHGGKCSEAWGTYTCQCKDGYGGKDCSQGLKPSWKFHGDGVLSFNPLLRPIQLPWINSLSVRTLQKDAFLMNIQVGQNSSATMSLKNGLLEYSYNHEVVRLRQGQVSDGQWHHVEAKWMSTEVWLSLDYGQREVTQTFNGKVQGLYVGKILIGGPDPSYTSINTDFGYFQGCVQDVKVGSQQSSLQRPTVEDNVTEGCSAQSQCDVAQSKCPAHADCVDQWERSSCECHSGWVGHHCADVCQFDPCENSGRCDRDTNSAKGYRCYCNSDQYSGEYCEKEIDQPCPSSWWGYPVCGPCECNVDLGYNPDCNKTTGQCYCKENHYQPLGSTDWRRCLPCDCYSVGSVTSKCDHGTGQCQCRPGVIGRRCDSCTNPYAEVTVQGCQVVYDGCPRNFAAGLWWDRTNFGESTVSNCPAGSTGKGSRPCDSQLSSWGKPDLFNCTTHSFSDLRKVLSQLEANELFMNTFVSIKVASDLSRATNLTANLYGADVLVTQQLLTRLIEYELRLVGLNLTHSQDKDYIQNLVSSSSVILADRYSEHWSRITELTGMGPVEMTLMVERYLKVLTSSQTDTYTNPFEIVATNMVLGLDVVTSSSLFGYESSSHEGLSTDKAKVVLPDTSQFLHPSIEGKTHKVTQLSPMLAFPKYNNYLQDRRNFDPHSKVMIPLDMLGIRHLQSGEIGDSKAGESRAVYSYAVYREAGELFPANYDETVTKRWGIQLKVGSSIVSFDVLVPVTTSTQYDDSLEQLEVTELKSLSEIHLSSPVRLRLWIDSVKQPIRSSPQCVHWRTGPSGGQWSRAGCHTELPEEHNHLEPYLVNCTCYHLSTFAVLLDVVDLEYIPEPTFLEKLVTYIGFAISLSLLLTALLILTCIRGKATNSNSIHKNIVFCLFLGETIYFVALKMRRDLLEHEFPCKMIAMFLHYFWLSSFSWTLVDSLHLNRMLTELRDINHGQMRFYYCLGYGLPAIIVGLSVGVRADQYGNFYFCWLSIYESVMWSLVGPVCLSVGITLITLMLAVRTAFTLKDHVLGYGNLRTLVWVSVVFLPLLGIVWVLLILAVSEPLPLLPPALSLAVIIQSAFTLAGFCFVNARVRRNLYVSCLKCLGKEIPKDLDLSVDAIGSSSNLASDRPGIARSALAYRSTDGAGVGAAGPRRNMGISTSSTTSRSTAKTSSSPYRSDTQLRGASNTDTSTSNYNSTSELPSFMRGYSSQQKIKEEGSRQSDSDSDNSVDGRSLELASSHSSDDDESSRQHRSVAGGSTIAPNYLPNICETSIAAPPTLNVISQSELFPNLAPLYAPRWSSQIPPTFLPANLGDLREEETSPQPLPDPHGDYPSDPHKLAALDSPVYETNLDRTYHVNLATVYENDPHKLDNYNTDLSEFDSKRHVTDKYLFPYTAEEDHCPVSTLPSSNRLVSRDHDSPGPQGSIRSRDSPVYSAAPSYRDSPGLYGHKRDSPLHYPLHRESPQFGHSMMRASPLLPPSHRSSANHTPLLLHGPGVDAEPNISESEKDTSETPV